MSDELKRKLARDILRHIPQEGVIAFGSGKTVNAIIRSIGDNVEKYANLIVLSGSSLTSETLTQSGIKETFYSPGMEIDLCIDGADQICSTDPHYILKGRGGALLREKVLWRAAEKVYVAVTDDKIVPAINGAIPIEFDPFAYPHVLKMLKFFYQDFSWELRKHTTGIPFYSDGGNYIIDLHPPSSIGDPHGVAYRLKGITGVIESGLFTDFSNVTAYIVDDTETRKLQLNMQ